MLVQLRANDLRGCIGVGLRVPQDEDPPLTVVVVTEHGHTATTGLCRDERRKIVRSCLRCGALPGLKPEPNESCEHGRTSESSYL